MSSSMHCEVRSPKLNRCIRAVYKNSLPNYRLLGCPRADCDDVSIGRHFDLCGMMLGLGDSESNAVLCGNELFELFY